jgi:CHAD domain-containing protein
MADELEQARKALRELRKSLKSLPGDTAPKAVHKLRTASRRVEALAAALSVGDRKQVHRLLQSIEPVRRAAGGVRDMDVLMAHARRLTRVPTGNSLIRLAEHLAGVRQEKADELRRVLDRRRKASLESLKQYSKFVKSALAGAKPAAPRQPGLSLKKVRAAAMELQRELGAWPPLKAGNLHAFRLKVKLLRYTLQLDAEAEPRLVEALGEVQRLVGDWHDWQQLEEIAREVLDAKRDAVLLDRIGRTTKRRFAQSLSAANRLRRRYLAMPPANGV